MKKFAPLVPGDKVAVLSPSFGAPAVWPHVYELGLERLREVFKLEPVEFPSTRMKDATTEQRSADLIAAFERPDIRAVIATIGGDDQVTYVKDLPVAPFAHNPKPFFGFSDNTHFANFLWQHDVPSYYGGCLFTQFAMQGQMDDLTVEYLKAALFERSEKELRPSKEFNDVYLDWDDRDNLKKTRTYEPNSGWHWDGDETREGLTWGGCLESIDEMLRHGIEVPDVERFDQIVLLVETSEEMPPHTYVRRVFRSFGERGWLQRVQAVLVGRPQTYNHDVPLTPDEKDAYAKGQKQTMLDVVRHYNQNVPVVQNLDFGHTNPQIAIPYGGMLRVDATNQSIHATF